MCVESTANSCRITGINQWCNPGSVGLKPAAAAAGEGTDETEYRRGGDIPHGKPGAGIGRVL